jgi:hypothetical protein
VPARRLDGERVDRLAERTERMDHGVIDARRRHLGQRIVDRVGRDLAMVPGHLGVLPEVDLGINDQPGGPPVVGRMSIAMARGASAGCSPRAECV